MAPGAWFLVNVENTKIKRRSVYLCDGGDSGVQLSLTSDSCEETVIALESHLTDYMYTTNMQQTCVRGC